QRITVRVDTFLTNDGLIENIVDSISNVKSAIVYRHAYTHGNWVKHIRHAYNNARWQDLLARSQSKLGMDACSWRLRWHSTVREFATYRSATIEFVLASHTDERRKDFSAIVRHLLRNIAQVPRAPLPPRTAQLPIAVQLGES